MLLSKACEYGIRAALYLASLDEEGYVPISRISDDLDLSFPFLTKIFQQLNDAGLLESHRGPSGGVALTRSPDSITLYEVIVAIDGEELFTECVLGLPGCGEEKPCPFHDVWVEESERLEEVFRKKTLGEMAREVGSSDIRLAV